MATVGREGLRYLLKIKPPIRVTAAVARSAANAR
jgi:hypothetical protein